MDKWTDLDQAYTALLMPQTHEMDGEQKPRSKQTAQLYLVGIAIALGLSLLIIGAFLAYFVIFIGGS